MWVFVCVYVCVVCGFVPHARATEHTWVWPGTATGTAINGRTSLGLQVGNPGNRTLSTDCSAPRVAESE